MMTTNTDNNASQPWVEKYRPSTFDEIVLEDINKNMLKNITEFNCFPNLLLYGPPGTGKTTTIINLVKCYQERYNQTNKGLMIHLNASDERGIDTIRNQISHFVHSKALFSDGLKIIILDEVDYMTKNAQQALKYLLQDFRPNVRFCLICNYISRIDDSLQNELLHLRFNQLPKEKIIEFLSTINKAENLNASIDTLNSIQRLFKSDIRSMINYMQSNQDRLDKCKVVDDEIWKQLSVYLKSNEKDSNNYIYFIEENYDIDMRNIVKDYLNYVIRKNNGIISSEFLDFCEFTLHLQDPHMEYLKCYFLSNIVKWAGSL
ncbi:MAG: hypothetical protein CBC22_04800 [Alphaproteobacteria bacterium TMED62]|nr:MAG: hypothetical protein CBC22_04800 [Alphaproteobacteria bacterium TMED62]